MAHYDAMLAEGRHGPLSWLEDRRPREDPRRLLPDCKSVVVLGFDYGGPIPPDPGGLTGRVARYAWGADYHNLVMRRVRKLQRRLQAEFPGLESYSSVDSRPVFERAWAARAGLGWAGKNTCQILPSTGSWFFLATLMLNRELPADAPIADFCGKCRRCVDDCPTGALAGDGSMDARLCISTWTIEVDGPIPEEIRPKIGRWVFGCDDCQEVCPHSRDPEVVEALRPRHAWLDLAWILEAPDAVLKEHFVGTPIARVVPHRLRRNAVVVLGNLGDPAAKPVLERVRGEMDVEWALARLPP